MIDIETPTDRKLARILREDREKIARDGGEGGTEPFVWPDNPSPPVHNHNRLQGTRE